MLSLLSMTFSKVVEERMQGERSCRYLKKISEHMSLLLSLCAGSYLKAECQICSLWFFFVMFEGHYRIKKHLKIKLVKEFFKQLKSQKQNLKKVRLYCFNDQNICVCYPEVSIYCVEIYLVLIFISFCEKPYNEAEFCISKICDNFVIVTNMLIFPYIIIECTLYI